MSQFLNFSRSDPPDDSPDRGWLGRYWPHITAGFLAAIPILTHSLEHTVYVLPVFLGLAQPAAKKSAKERRPRPLGRRRIRRPWAASSGPYWR